MKTIKHKKHSRHIGTRFETRTFTWNEKYQNFERTFSSLCGLTHNWYGSGYTFFTLKESYWPKRSKKETCKHCYYIWRMMERKD